MDCAGIVDRLLTNERLVSLLPKDQTGHPAVYQIIAPESELFPRIAVFESERQYTRFVDDLPFEERTAFRVDIYARENVLREIAALLLSVLTVDGFRRYATIQDDYLPDQGVYVKSVTYEYFEELPVPGVNC